MIITEKIIDLVAGTETIIEREETEQEKIAREAEEAFHAQKEAERLAKEAARQAVLDKLGLTAEDIAALGL